MAALQSRNFGMSKPIRQVMIVGSGVMGRGILATFAGAGFDCLLLSRNPKKLRDLPAGVRVVAAPPAEPPDLVFENIIERLAPKLTLFRELGELYGGRSILASNTSALPLQKLADATAHPELFCGIHYYQPAEDFDFCELISVAETAPEVIARVTEALRKTGKRAVHLKQPVIGHLVNRLQHAMLHEAFYLIEQGIVTAEGVDLLAKNLIGPRMCVTGLIEQKDLSGLDTTALSQQGVVPHLHHGAEPIKLLQDMAARGDTGVKSGRGFYDWKKRDVPAVRRQAADKLARILAILREPAEG
jgi:3-hydroxybutyryl-CoA dehydrogenase